MTTSPNLKLNEAPICAAGVKRLRDAGWRVVCEVPHLYRTIDAVAIRDGNVLVMEAKTRLTEALKRQIYTAELSADLAIVIVGGRVRESGVQWCRERKIGLWCVNGETVIEIVAPQTVVPLSWQKERLLKSFARYEHLDATGGLPCQKGVGVAQSVQAAVNEYRTAHPKATWKEIFAAVSSHYDSAKNMYSALRSNQERLAIRARLKARRIQDSDRAAGTAA